jgi:cytochrome c
MARTRWLPLIGLLTVAMAHPADAAGDPEAGAQVFRTCSACHTLEPGVHRTGPSLAGLFGRKAGTGEDFHRYSDALRSADLVWREDTLNRFLADPQAFLPGNRMTFPGIADAQGRADVIAYLQTATVGRAQAQAWEQGGMMATPQLLDLRREVGPNNRITWIGYCGDTYTVGVESGEPHPFWEFNLRFKTDSSDKGPEPGPRQAHEPYPRGHRRDKPLRAVRRGAHLQLGLHVFLPECPQSLPANAARCRHADLHACPGRGERRLCSRKRAG